MKELTLQELKDMSLLLLQDMHEFCISNNIKYSLAYGTLIGAIRHQGFIPWDDDIDVMMPRPDYERFCREYVSKKGYRIFAPQLNNSYLSYARICECEKTEVVSPAPWATQKTGVWIDIFPVDGIEDDETKIKTRFAKAMAFYKQQIGLRFFEQGRRTNLKDGLRYYLRMLLGKTSSAKSFAKQCDNYFKEIPFDANKYVANCSCPNSGKCYLFMHEDFENYQLVPFDGHTFCIISGYDRVLRASYGDYMQLPPVEKRVVCHSAHKYYWK